MKNTYLCLAVLALMGCGPGSEATATESPSGTTDSDQLDIYKVQIERKPAPAGFYLRRPNEGERVQEIRELEAQFQPFMEADQRVWGTYRYLEAGKNVLVEKIAYMNAGPRYGNQTGPIYVHYMSVRDGNVVSILCMPHKPIASVPVASSNCAREVGATLGAEFLALIRSDSGGK